MWFTFYTPVYYRVDKKNLHLLTLSYMGRDQRDPPSWLLSANPKGMPWIGWFFMTLFLSTFERFWVGHFLDFLLKILKIFTLTIFSIQNPKGGPLPYRQKNTIFIGSFSRSKIVLISLFMQKIGAKIIYFCQNMHFHQILIVLIDFNRGGSFWSPFHVITYVQKSM